MRKQEMKDFCFPSSCHCFCWGDILNHVTVTECEMIQQCQRDLITQYERTSPLSHQSVIIFLMYELKHHMHLSTDSR